MIKLNKRILYFSIVLMILVLMNVCGCVRKENNQTIGTVNLNIETYLAGKNQPTHPSVVAFDDKWNGYTYWMSYTPYPQANGEEENPSIAVSNDLYEWKTPEGMLNPIADNEETGCDELKDSHILYRNDLKRLEVWYLGRLSEKLGGDGKQLLLFRKYSYDGVNWSDFEVMTEVKYLSPSISWDGEKYQMWGIGYGGYNTEGTIVYQESIDGITWTKPVQCEIGGQSTGIKIWHGAVSKDEDAYKLVYIETGSDSQTIKYCESTDGIHFTKEKSIVENDNTTLWNRLYRPYLLKENGEYYVFYGVITKANEWYISMSHGEDINSLVGITETDKVKMTPMDYTITDCRSIGWKVHEIYDNMRNYIRFELIIMLPIILLGMLLLRKTGMRKIVYNIIGEFITICLCLSYTYFRVQATSLEAVVSIAGVSLIEGISIYCIASFCLMVYVKTNCKLKIKQKIK